MATKKLGATPPKRRRRGEYGARIVTSGPRMFKTVLKLNKQQLRKWVADENNRPTKAIWLKRKPKRESVHKYSFNTNLDDNTDYAEDFNGPLQLNPAVLNFRKPRQRAKDRQKLAQNWQEAEKRLVDVLDGHEIAPCSCASKDIVEVRHIELGCMYILKPS